MNCHFRGKFRVVNFKSKIVRYFALVNIFSKLKIFQKKYAQNLLTWQANIFTDFYYITLFSQIETDLAQLESTETLTECVLHIFLEICMQSC